MKSYLKIIITIILLCYYLGDGLMQSLKNYTEFIEPEITVLYENEKSTYSFEMAESE